MFKDNTLWIAKGENPVCILPKMANRHGLIAGATGTGKSVTLKVLAESFSDAGVPVFLADIKSDLAGTCKPGMDNEGMQKRIAKFGIENWEYKGYPTQFWDVFGESGHPVRTTISSMGHILLSRLLGLNDTQTGVLNIVFKVADDKKLLLIDIKDLKAMLQYCSDHAKDFQTTYGSISDQTIGTILRSILNLEQQGGDLFFGEPAVDIMDWMKVDGDGHGFINILHCVKLYRTPQLYATFMLWLLSDLFEILPEAGDAEKPKMVFFFDEAHLLFNDAPKYLLDMVEQVVRLIRSKGVGIYFISQSPTDMPDSILAQLGNRIQHALRAYSPAEQKAVKSAAETFRENPAFKTIDAITDLATGEALVSFLDEEGRPQMVERAYILPPQSLMGPIDDNVRFDMMSKSGLGPKYDQVVDNESAFEDLQDIAEEEAKAQEEAAKEAEKQKEAELIAKEDAKQKAKDHARHTKTVVEVAAGAAVATLSREVSKELVKGVEQSLGLKSKKSSGKSQSSMGKSVTNSLVRGILGVLKK